MKMWKKPLLWKTLWWIYYDDAYDYRFEDMDLDMLICSTRDVARRTIKELARDYDVPQYTFGIAKYRLEK